MKTILFVTLLLFARPSFGLEKPVTFWSYESAYLHFVDWHKPGLSKTRRGELLKTLPIRTGFLNVPDEIRFLSWPTISSETSISEYQLAIAVNYRDGGSKERQRKTLWVGQNCDLEIFRNEKAKSDSIIVAIYDGASEKVRTRIFRSKACKEILRGRTKGKG